MVDINLFSFNTGYLNRHKKAKEHLDPQRDIRCWKCGEVFDPDDEVISIIRGSARLRHVDCAVFAGVITRGDLRKLKQLMLFSFGCVGGVWLLFMAQQIIRINS